MDNRNIPELMRCICGKTVQTAAEWTKFRREEILALFSHFVYGVRPVGRPEDLEFTVLGEKEVAPGIVCREVRASFRGGGFVFQLYLPAGYVRNLPVFIYLLLEGQERLVDLDHTLENPYIPIEELIKRKYALAVLKTTQIYPDEMADVNYDPANRVDYRKGIFTLLERRNERNSASWATISAWSWGLSRVADYLENAKECDNKRMMVVGHSRGGKTALWCGATDKRIAIAISSCSGCSGAAVTRGKKGEHVNNINGTDWFCQNYQHYNDHEEYLPVDQHMLLALMAPRAVYVSSAILDEWADPQSEYLSCRLAGEAFELLGKKGLVSEDEEPVLGKMYHEGNIGYHMHEGGHRLCPEDWIHYMDYADKLFAK